MTKEMINEIVKEYYLKLDNNEDPDLSEYLFEELQNAIIPKFKKGDIVWHEYNGVIVKGEIRDCPPAYQVMSTRGLAMPYYENELYVTEPKAALANIKEGE